MKFLGQKEEPIMDPGSTGGVSLGDHRSLAGREVKLIYHSL